MSVTCDRMVVSSTSKADSHDITEILLKVALNTINQPPKFSSTISHLSPDFVAYIFLYRFSDLYQNYLKKNVWWCHDYFGFHVKNKKSDFWNSRDYLHTIHSIFILFQVLKLCIQSCNVIKIIKHYIFHVITVSVLSFGFIPV